MAGFNIGDVILRMLVDDATFSADVQKSAAAAGDKAGATLGQRMGKGMSKGLTAVGAGAGVLFGIAAKGANDLTNAMASFQAETGATADELDSARASVLELSKTNIQSFAEIADAQAALRTDLGLTQKEAEAASEAFLNYATATGQDAAEGVRALDDILDNWNLTADDAQGVMDRLIVSHQKWGGSITDNQKTLAKLAPAMQAANFQVDDGIALLGLFGAKGLDSERAAAAFSKALTKVKSPDELKALIKDIQDTEDPFLRAQKAADLFGAKAGAQLANALGGANLDDYVVSMDEAAGATERASEAIEKTPFNQLKMALSAIASPAIEAGQSFGPLILALSQLGGGKLLAGVLGTLGGVAGALTSKLGPRLQAGFVKAFGRLIIPSSVFAKPIEAGIEGGLEQVAGSSKLKGATGKIGDLLGTKLGKALSVAFAAVMVVEVVNTYNDVRAKLNEQSEQIGKEVGNQMVAGTTDQLEQSKSAIEAGLKKLSGVWDAGLFTGEQRRKLETQLANVNAELAKRAAAAGPTVGDALASGEAAVTAGTVEMVSGIPGALADMKKAAKAGGRAAFQAFAAGTKQKRGVVADALSALRDALSNEMSPAKERARLLGQLAGKELARGLKSKDPVVKQAAIDAREAILTRLKELIPANGKLGKKAGAELAAALKSKDPTVRAAAQQIKATIQRNIKANTKPAGVSAGKGVVTGLNTQRGPVGTAAANLAKVIIRRIRGTIYSSTPTRRGDQVSGGGISGYRASGGYTAKRRTYMVGEQGPELWTPDQSGTVISAARTRALMSETTAPAAGDTINVTVPVQGALPVRTIRDLANEMRRVGEVGLLRPRTVPPLYRRQEASSG